MDAMNVYERKGRRRSIRLRAAAVAAAVAILLTAVLWPRQDENGIVTAPGVLRVYAYDLSSGTELDNMVSYELEDSIVEATRDYTWFMNSLYGLPLTLKYDDDAFENMDITFDVSVEHGGFYGDIHSDKYRTDKEDTVASLKDVDLGQEFTVENGETIFWRVGELLDEAAAAGLYPDEYMESIGNVICVEIVIKADWHIVGYALLNIVYEDGFFAASVNQSICFPLVDGKFQEITLDELNQHIGGEG